MLESKFQKKVMEYIKEKGGLSINYNPGATGKGGFPDLVACIKGIFCGIELKTNSKLTLRQALSLEMISRAGGEAITLVESKDWKSIIDKLFLYIHDRDVIDSSDVNHINYTDIIDEEDWDE